VRDGHPIRLVALADNGEQDEQFEMTDSLARHNGHLLQPNVGVCNVRIARSARAPTAATPLFE
jgi:hypothetical protein